MNIRITQELKESFDEAVQKNGLDSSTAIRVLMLEYTRGHFEIGVKTVFDQEIAQGAKDYLDGNYKIASSNKEIDAVLDE